jgi:hypothetical protein
VRRIEQWSRSLEQPVIDGLSSLCSLGRRRSRAAGCRWMCRDQRAATDAKAATSLPRLPRFRSVRDLALTPFCLASGFVSICLFSLTAIDLYSGLSLFAICAFSQFVASPKLYLFGWVNHYSRQNDLVLIHMRQKGRKQ